MGNKFQQAMKTTSLAIILCIVAFKSMADPTKLGKTTCCIQCETEQAACEFPCDNYISPDSDTCMGICNTLYNTCTSACELPCQDRF